ncbi:MAG: hypothetical protein NT033_00120, partial [Candidatus Omnitrophica bacterium]|nr:hypothetical protein [Candidatus Omnitrophota bacterium]
IIEGKSSKSNPSMTPDLLKKYPDSGFPMAQTLARIIGGTVSVESEVGKGTTFTIRLPLAKKNEPIPVSAEEGIMQEIHYLRNGLLRILSEAYPLFGQMVGQRKEDWSDQNHPLMSDMFRSGIPSNAQVAVTSVKAASELYLSDRQQDIGSAAGEISQAVCALKDLLAGPDNISATTRTALSDWIKQADELWGKANNIAQLKQPDNSTQVSSAEPVVSIAADKKEPAPDVTPYVRRLREELLRKDYSAALDIIMEALENLLHEGKIDITAVDFEHFKSGLSDFMKAVYPNESGPGSWDFTSLRDSRNIADLKEQLKSKLTKLREKQQYLRAWIISGTGSFSDLKEFLKQPDVEGLSAKEKALKYHDYINRLYHAVWGMSSSEIFMKNFSQITSMTFGDFVTHDLSKYMELLGVYLKKDVNQKNFERTQMLLNSITDVLHMWQGVVGENMSEYTKVCKFADTLTDPILLGDNIGLMPYLLRRTFIEDPAKDENLVNFKYIVSLVEPALANLSAGQALSRMKL